MSDPAPNAELMRALGRLVRGLSALFWGLPAALVVCFNTAKADYLKAYQITIPLACTGLLAYGIWQLGAFQKQERVWRKALDRAQILSLMMCGLSPFLFWSNRLPTTPFFSAMVGLLVFCGVLFLASLNLVLQRLSAMLPDEGLRLETRQFTSLNLNLLLATFMVAVAYGVLARFPQVPVPHAFQSLMKLMDRGVLWPLLILVVPLVLLPMAMTMALLWKTKEVILENVFSPKPS